MNRFMMIILKTDFGLFVISGLALMVMMGVTLVDVIMRSLGKPIVGSVELISFFGALAVGMAIPYTSWTKGHILVDFAVEKLSPKSKSILLSITRFIGIGLFLLAGYNFILFGFDMIKSNTVSGAFKLPLYPVAFGLSLSCFLQSATLLCDFLKIVKGEEHE